MKDRVLQQLKIERLHMASRALDLASTPVRQHFSHLWAPLDALLEELQPLPEGLVRFWLGQTGGHVVITHLSSYYDPGDYLLKHDLLHNIAYVGLADLAVGSLEALVPVGHLLDHLLGNGGQPEGLWLSEGGGADPALQRAGTRIAALFPLGYGFDVLAQQDQRNYLARSLALYWHDRSALNVADPLLERLLRTTLFSEAFWRSRQSPQG
ncbi:MAG: hypothetical protein FJ026_03095 [Chloroflexi bacterium]|nr:hypothetical protein [Chloroflexota bacterium]